MTSEREVERAAVLAWLRREMENWPLPHSLGKGSVTALKIAVDAIERGAHLPAKDESDA